MLMLHSSPEPGRCIRRTCAHRRARSPSGPKRPKEGVCEGKASPNHSGPCKAQNGLGRPCGKGRATKWALGGTKRRQEAARGPGQALRRGPGEARPKEPQEGAMARPQEASRGAKTPPTGPRRPGEVLARRVHADMRSAAPISSLATLDWPSICRSDTKDGTPPATTEHFYRYMPRRCEVQGAKPQFAQASRTPRDPPPTP